MTWKEKMMKCKHSFIFLRSQEEEQSQDFDNNEQEDNQSNANEYQQTEESEYVTESANLINPPSKNSESEENRFQHNTAEKVKDAEHDSNFQRRYTFSERELEQKRLWILNMK